MKRRHGKLKLVKQYGLIVGVDLGKLRHVAALQLSGGTETRTVQFDNDRAGFERLSEAVNSLRVEAGLEWSQVILGMEPTGHYGLPLAYWWADHKGSVVLVSPMHTNRAKELSDNSPLKNDTKDAGVIAWLISQGNYLECHLPRGVFATLRDLVRQRKRCADLASRLNNQLHQAVDRVFPELEKAFSSFRVNSCRQMLLHCADPEVVAAMSPIELGALLRSWSNGQLKEDRAAKLIELAATSIGIREGKAAMISEVRRLVRQLQAATDECKELVVEIRECLREVPGAALLLSVPDFGVLTVAGILAHTGDLRNYAHPDQVIKLAGLSLYELSSGQHRGPVHITKRGQAGLRKVLYMAALRACRHQGSLRPYYAGLVGRGVAPTSALIAVMRKLTRVIWALVKRSQSFDLERLRGRVAEAA